MKRIVVLLLLLMVFACAKPTGQEQAETLPGTASEQAQESAKQPPSATESTSTQTEPEVGRKPPSVTPPSEKVPSQTAPTTSTAPKESLSPQIRDLLKRSQEKLTSVQYLYGGTATNNLFLNTYLHKGDKVKVKLYEENYYVRDGYYDNAYINLGLGCCEELSRCRSHNVDNTGKKFTLEGPVLTLPKSPMSWMTEIESNAIVVGPQTFNSRSVTHVKYVRSDGSEVLMWIDDTYGVPHKIEIQKDGTVLEKHQFNDMQFNGLKDAEFDAPCD